MEILVATEHMNVDQYSTSEMLTGHIFPIFEIVLERVMPMPVK